MFQGMFCQRVMQGKEVRVLARDESVGLAHVEAQDSRKQHNTYNHTHSTNVVIITNCHTLIITNYVPIVQSRHETMATMTEPTRPSTTSRRSFTLPSRLPTTGGEHPETDATGAETLFAHSAARVVSFSASKIVGPAQDKQDASPLPWASRSERVISLGTAK